MYDNIWLEFLISCIDRNVLRDCSWLLWVWVCLCVCVCEKESICACVICTLTTIKMLMCNFVNPSLCLSLRSQEALELRLESFVSNMLHRKWKSAERVMPIYESDHSVWSSWACTLTCIITFILCWKEAALHHYAHLLSLNTYNAKQ